MSRTFGQIVLLNFALIMVPSITNSQWVRYGPEWQLVNSVAFDDDNGFAATRNGVYHSIDDGVSWSHANTGLGTKSKNRLAIDGRYVYSCTENGLFRSSDKGISWNLLGLEGHVVTSIVSFSGTLLASTGTQGVFRSSNDGNTWTTSNNGFGNLTINGLKRNDEYIFAPTAFGVYRSSNGGNNWISTNSWISNYFIYDICFLSNYIFACGSEMFVSTDNGANWSIRNGGLPSSNFYVLGTDSLAVYASGTFGMYKSTNYGQNWSSSGLNLFQVRSIAKHTSGIFAATNMGLQYSIDQGAGWRPMNSGMAPEEVGSVSSNLLGSQSGRVYIGTDIGVYETTDNGLSWNDLTFESLVTTHVRDIECISNYYFALTENGVFRSALYGNVWTFLIGGSDINSLAAHGIRLFAGKTNGIQYSDSYGNGWAFPGLNGHNVYKLHADAGSVIAGTTSGNLSHGIYFSTDNGIVWRISNWPTERELTAVGANNGKLFAGSYAGIFTSNDTGNTWSLLNAGIAPGFVAEIFYFKNNFAFVAGHSDSVPLSCAYLLSSSGSHWLDRSQGLIQDAGITSMSANLAYLFAGTKHHNVWRRSFTEITKVQEIYSSVHSFRLFQNYPNPFNPATKISFDLPQDSRVNLIVYDLLGREVTRLVNNEFKVADKYTYDFNGASNASGVYFYRLDAGEFQETKRMVLLK
jgi:photosystem II stability/assembly factor-like uncharacterized protein